MSISSLDSLTASLGTGGPINPAYVPAEVRDGTAATQKAYVEGLAFEQVLVGQLTQQLGSELDGSDSSDGSDGSDDGSEGTGGLGGSSGSSDPYSSLMTQTLTDSIMSGGGLGIATEIGRALDPTFGQPAEAAGSAGSAGPAGSSGGATA